MPYLKGIHRAKKSACFFCDYARAARKDRPNLVLHRGRTCFIVLNRYPYNTGHLMVAPLAHKAEMGRLGARERAELFELAVVAQKTLDRALRPHGYNLGMNLGRVAGAGIPGHLHLHLVPRWNGDTNFMPVVGRTRVVPQALDDLYSHLQKAMPDSR
jgi:ATP adenylyltransferase